jgi:phage-related protein
MEFFTWITPDAKLSKKPRIVGADFGDGYSQESPDGINADLETWALVFDDRYAEEVLAMNSFLTARKGTEKFEYTNRMGVVITVKCKEWDVKPAKKNRLTLTCTFNQVP